MYCRIKKGLPGSTQAAESAVETAWRTDEPCPVCGTGLVLVENGRPVLRAECRLCGYAGPFDTADLPDGDW